MWSIFKKEVNLFLSSLVGYITIGIFLVGTGLFLWVFPYSSVLYSGRASLDPFFNIAPYIFLFLIPAITMRTFAEELQTGTIELLATRPLNDWHIIGGKYLACLFLVAFSILPTFIYYFSIYELGLPKGNLDIGSAWGSYLGLFGLGAVFVAIGIFASSLTKNQIVAFLLACLLCFFFYFVLSSISRMPIFFGKLDHFVESLGLDYHYDSISRGLVDTRDIVYFLTMIALFLVFTKSVVERRHR